MHVHCPPPPPDHEQPHAPTLWLAPATCCLPPASTWLPASPPACLPACPQEYLQRYGEAACKQYDIPRWTLAALLAHVRAQEAALTDYMGALRCAALARTLANVVELCAQPRIAGCCWRRPGSSLARSLLHSAAWLRPPLQTPPRCPRTCARCAKCSTSFTTKRSGGSQRVSWPSAEGGRIQGATLWARAAIDACGIVRAAPPAACVHD